MITRPNCMTTTFADTARRIPMKCQLDQYFPSTKPDWHLMLIHQDVSTPCNKALVIPQPDSGWLSGLTSLGLLFATLKTRTNTRVFPTNHGIYATSVN